MFLSWLYKTWKILLTTITVLVSVIILVGILLFGALQLPQSQEYIAGQVMDLFNEQYQGKIEIKELDGMLPFSANLHKVRVFPTKESEDPVITLEKAMLRVSVWDLIRRNITIHSFVFDQPVIHLNREVDDQLTIGQAFKTKTTKTPDTESTTFFDRFHVYAPSIVIQDGEVIAERFVNPESESDLIPASFTLKNIKSDFYLELSSFQRFLDIDFFSANIPGNDVGAFTLRGQIFSDDQFLEFNGFQLQTDDSQLEFSGVASPVNIFQPDLAEQLRNADYRLDVENTWLKGQHISNIFPGYPFPNDHLDIELIVDGSRESLFVDRLIGRIGDNAVQMTGTLNNIHKSDFHYSGSLTNAVLQPDAIRLFSDTYLEFGDEELDYLAASRFSGQFEGDLKSMTTGFNIETEKGELALKGALIFDDLLTYNAEVTVDSLDLTPLLPKHLERNLLNGKFTVNGAGTTFDELNGMFSAEFDSGYVNHIEFSSGIFKGSFRDQLFEHELTINNGNAGIRSAGQLRKSGNQWMVSVNGATDNIDLNHLLQRDEFPHTSINLEFNTDLEWTEIDDLFGRISFEVDESVIGIDTLRSHQFYADLDAPNQSGDERNLRLTSSFLDAEVSGDIYPRNLYKLYRHWNGYVKNQIAEEIVMDSTSVMDPEAFTFEDLISSANLRVNMEMKDIELFQKYFSEDPIFESQSRMNLNLNADADRLLLTGSVNDSGFRFNDIHSNTLNANFTTSFQFAEKFREYGTLDLQLNAEDYRFRNYHFKNGTFNASMRSDSIRFQHSAEGGQEDVKLDLDIMTRLKPGVIDFTLNKFSFGSDEYTWTTEGTPKLAYNEDRSLLLENVNFVSNEERVAINGIYSNNEADSVEYNIRNLNLQRISDLIGGRVTFAGIVNGDFYTKTLADIPSFEGELKVKRTRLDNRLIGDVSVNSRYSTAEERFNTKISVLTNPDNYPDYFENNDNIGQNLVLDGYFKAPDLENPDEEYFYFDADLREIDMWIVTVIVPDIVIDMEGRSTGSGYIRGSLTDYDFNAEFDVQDVRGTPFFVNTSYNLNGKLIFDRHDGLIFENINLRDDDGGTGVLSGTIDLDNFSETTYLDLTLDLNNLRFMNNPYDPDVPFYATARGTGQARITGSNFSPFLRTTEPIVISPGSRISVPVVDDAELQQSYSFIQFVETFDWSSLREQDRMNNLSDDGSTFQFDPELLTFVERFTLDLQFIANDPVNFRLIFDRVTNEILSASGTGQIRLGLEDENFSIFGRMNITGGDYQFVAGDIISRRFQLSEGGSIIWEGDPANARLNVSATYRARPDLSALITSGSRELRGGQRFPVDLVLNIGGTLSELENDFFFQIPSSIEGTLDPTLLTQVNALNRNEEEKIIQATSLLLSGNFIPLSSASTEGGTGMALRETLTGGAVVVNPLLTSQVINPLLSDQINSLLRSDMALDIDFNLTTLNEIDLGVALRLYDDRLILRRDGVITGDYSDIGDLGATYRINRIFAVTAFHRQDPTLTNASAAEARQVQEMNGVGVEAQFQFNTWKELRQRFTGAISRLFGRKESPKEEEEDVDDRIEPIASE